MENNIKTDANKSSKYKTLFEVSEEEEDDDDDDDNNNNNNNIIIINIKTTHKEQGPIPQHCIWITTLRGLTFAP